MATLYRRGQTWWADYRVGHKRVQRSLKTRDKKIAEQVLKAIDGDLVRRVHQIPTKTSVASALNRFVADSAARNSVHWVEQQERRITGFVEWSGVKRPNDITASVIDAHLRERMKSRGLTFARRDFQIIRAFSRWLVRMGHLPSDPCIRVSSLPRPVLKTVRFLAPEEADRLLEACAEPVPFRGPGGKGQGTARERKTPLLEMAHVALFAGLRLGEIVALRWKDVDFLSNVLHVRVTETHVPKNKKERRVPLHSRLKAMLSSYRARTGKTSDLIFPTSSGTTYDAVNLGKELAKAGKRAGLEQVNFYLLRHTFASWLVQENVSLYKVAKFLGHSSVRVTEMHYAALVPEDLHSDIEKLRL